MIRAAPPPVFEDAAPDEDPARRSRRVFAGDLLVFRRLPAMARLTEHLNTRLCAALNDPDPETAEQRLDPAAFRSGIGAWRTALATDPLVRATWRETMETLGYRADSLFVDRLNGRSAAVRPAWRGRRGSIVPVHRDTWGSGIAMQVNWWAPIRPVSADRTMVLWPHLFAVPVENDSGTWSLETLRARTRAGHPDGYPLLPSVTRPVPDEDAVPVLIDPGDLLMFAGAHLHASRATDTERARFSLDTRSVWRADLDAGRGAPMVDAAGGEVQWAWFESLETGETGATLSPPPERPPAGSGLEGRRRN
ncbi:hypothetical protein [Roseospira navarrensis]|uniref:Phytanoyl-CoA dioxygenase n=1 Tax=Roseospira navarrensis TaxID=140058 RepID=A0A7X1ZHH5_9PROT|nr:hypothetical protein [Roseospira navarrensis]MQX37305.1 hypothetical protein [Roseospira navarrensis]